MQTPSQVKVDQLTFADSVPNLITQALEKNKKLTVCDVLQNDQVVSLKLVGHLTTNAIQVDSNFNGHSIGFEFDDDADLEAFLELYKVFDTVAALELKVVDMVRQKRIYLKLKINPKTNAYVTRSNVKLSPKSPGDAPLVRYQKVEVQVDLKAYFSIEDPKTCGFYFDMFNILFDTSK
jgi:hypothetical protein